MRSQDKLDLIKCTSIHIEETPGIEEVAIKSFNYGDKYTYVGYYESKERALEVLEEIQSKLKGTFLMKMKDEKYSKFIECGKRYLEELNGVCVVTGDSCFDIEPINADVIVYEMPKE